MSQRLRELREELDQLRPRRGPQPAPPEVEPGQEQ